MQSRQNASEGPKTRRAVAVAVAAVSIGVVLHVAVLAAWHLSVLPELEHAARAERASAAFVRLPSDRLGAWPVVEVRGVRIRLPLHPTAVATSPACDLGCRVPLDEGILRVEPHLRTETYWETVLLLAPDRSDVSIQHSPWHNWEAMLSLSRFVLQQSRPRATWRFESPGSRGVVTTHANHGILRHVVYAYDYDGNVAPALLFSRVRSDRLLEMIASLELDPVDFVGHP